MSKIIKLKDKDNNQLLTATSASAVVTLSGRPVETVLSEKVDKSSIVQGLGSSTTNISSQKAVTEELDKKLDISAPTVNETVIKAMASSTDDMLSI